MINRYAAISSIDFCSGTLTVDSTEGFIIGEQVMVYQAQGAQISEENNNQFGVITNLNQAGKYEINEVAEILDNNTLVLKFALVHDYEMAGKVQLITIPVYQDASVETSITAQAWNGDKGGVLALRVEGTLVLEGSVDVSGKGFRGGVSLIEGENDCGFLTNVNAYALGLNNWRGAPKGEGVAQKISGKEMNRQYISQQSLH